MATVYVALDQRLDREVALKVMRPDLARDETFVGRFRREARSAAKLSHPNVVAVYDQGEDDGNMFLAMELVHGLTLRQVMQAEGPLTPRAALDILDPVLQALGAAHSAGLIHRDVKPENVILRDDGTVKVADFGLARAVDTVTSTAQTGVLLGTVAYLSPEQVERGKADARSDVYAAGLLLFEMLTGSKAFIGDSPIHVAYQHVHSSVPLPSSRVSTVPVELDLLVARASARDPDNRPRDANELLVEMRQARRGLTPAELDIRPAGVGGATHANSTIALPRTEVVPAVAAPRRTRVEHDGLRRLMPRGLTGRRPNRRMALFALLLLAAAAALWFFTVGPGATTTVPKVKGSTPVRRGAATAGTTSVRGSAIVELAGAEPLMPAGRRSSSAGVSPRRAWRISASISLASRGRLSGSRALARATSRSSSTGTVLTRLEGRGTLLWTCWYATWMGESPMNALDPVSISNSSSPAA